MFFLASGTCKLLTPLVLCLKFLSFQCLSQVRIKKEGFGMSVTASAKHGHMIKGLKGLVVVVVVVYLCWP